MRHGLALPSMAPADRLIELAVTAENSGWDAVFLDDHVRMPPGSGLEPHDPWVLLGAIAHATGRIRLGAMVTPLARRRPHKFAKEVATLDHVSGGRVITGVGLGNLPDDEFAAFGDEPDAKIRAERTDEALKLVAGFWSGDRIVHHGKHFTVDAELRPVPVQRPRPPLWIACGWPARRPLARARRWDGAIIIDRERGFLDPAGVSAVVAALGPVPEGFDVIALRAPGQAPAGYAAAGATWLLEARAPAGDWLSELEATAGRAPG
ncbi:LLM class flavin-dependent oxidoreductase [Amycolatopsis anabasis]|uniref:LLM class flavin-dependent oxidoreductase n=1 Tax=Amycolatopsis anabasis TaxID=1840409 RepID=UPI00131E5BF5|nr:LLM class flavin-dependent oxidoreductase [Amycolatopsis anabasis]